MTGELKRNVRRRETWQRLLFILLFGFIYTVAEIVVAATIVLQFGFELFTAARNRNLLELGASLSRYVYEILRYVTYNSDQRPFPFAPWPAPEGASRTRAAGREGGAARRSRTARKGGTARGGGAARGPSDQTQGP